MNLDELRSLLEQIQNDPTQVTDEQITQAQDAIRAQVAEARSATATADTVAVLRQLVEVRDAVAVVATQRATEAAEVNAEAERLMGDLDRVDEPATPDAGDGDSAAEVVDETTGNESSADARAPELVLAASALAAAAKALAAFVPAPAAAVAQATPQGRTAKRIGTLTSPATTAPRDPAIATVKASGDSGEFKHGQPINSTAELGRAFADRLRSSSRGSTGKEFVARVETKYPDSRTLRADDFDGNLTKLEQLTSPNALVAAGGLCAPLETLYDVEVVGSVARPIRDQALARFQVGRGGIQFRPNFSAATAVYGAGVWTMTDDAADPVGSKGCYVVDCPGIEEKVIEAVFLCLEFGNITARFDPEVTAANVQQGLIAHARLAENRLLAAMAADSKILSAPKVVGATRDILVNLDKSTAYYRNRHRIDTDVALTFALPGWVKSMMRADIARQMANGDWQDALGIADSQIDTWFRIRGVSPVWHLDGPAGLDEVQTVTITGGPTGGSFTLTYNGQTTSPIAFNATAATVKAALAALNNVKAEDITVTGGPGPATPYVVTFGGGVTDGQNVAQMTVANTFTGGTSPTVAVTTTTGGGGAITVNGVSIASQTYPDAAAGSAIPGFPDQIDSLLYVSGSKLFLDGGNLDLGLVRDSDLNDRNRYRQFSETFEGTADRGIESLRLVMSVQPTGGSAGTVDTSGITD